MDKQKIYFPNLNGIRFIAAFLVIIHHVEQIKAIFKLDNYFEKIPFITIIGRLGVVLFFVLSGFLITYLLLVEEFTIKTISIRKFYIRRILRIWPLYFFIIILAFFILPNFNLFILPGYSKELIYSNLTMKLILFTVFFPNLVLVLYGIIPFASHTWSIGTEEQFYLVWPILLKYFKKNRVLLMFLVIAFYEIFKIFLFSHFTNFIINKQDFIGFWKSFSIQCMAIGGVFAILLFNKSIALKVLQNNIVFYATLLVVLYLIINGIRLPYYHYEIYSTLFGILILNFASNKNIKISLENKVLNYLGNISYGLYMYHPIAIVLAITLCSKMNCISNWLLYPISLALTIIIAGLSYKYFESYFLKFKHKFSNIISGNK